MSTETESEGDGLGAPSTRVDTYECVGSGQVRLDGYYYLPWEPDSRPEEPNFTLNLIVD